MPSTDEDPVAAWRVASGNLLEVLSDPGMVTTAIETPTGSRQVEALSAGLCRDLVVHMWDLCRAAGLDDRLDPEDVRTSFEEVRPMDQMMRAPGLLGPKVEVAADADEQTRFIAFMGRRP